MTQVKAVALGISGILLLGVLLVILKYGIWPPDLFRRNRPIVLDAIVKPDGEYLRLIQYWVGDGYATEFIHTEGNGKIWFFAIYGDAKKAWSGCLRQTNSTVTI